MQRRKFTREFKLEAVRLIRGRGESVGFGRHVAPSRASPCNREISGEKASQGKPRQRTRRR